MSLAKKEILRLLQLLNDKLALKQCAGELYLVGGAVMCVVHEARESTKDLDAYFRPADIVRKLAVELAEEQSLDKSWLNDSVKGFLSEQGEYQSFLELPFLKVLTASPEYLLAMKCLSMRLGEEFHDEEDVRFLLRFLNVESYDEAKRTIETYYPLERFPQKTLYALEEIIGG